MNALFRSSNSEFADHLEYDSLRHALRRARLGSYPREPCTLASLDSILKNPLYGSLSAVTDTDCLYRGSTTSRDGSVIIVLLSNRCADVLKWTPCLHAFTLSITLRTNVMLQVHTIGTTLGNSVSKTKFNLDLVLKFTPLKVTVNKVKF